MSEDRWPGLPLRVDIAKQLGLAGLEVMRGVNPVRRIRKALRLLSAAPLAPSKPDRDLLEPAFRVLRPLARSEPRHPLCLFVTFASDGRPWAHTLRYCADLRRLGLKLVLILVTDRPDVQGLDPGPEVADAVMVRENHGYDFAAWARVLQDRPDLLDAPEVWFVNDSVYHSNAALEAMARRVRASTADVVALTESAEIRSHFQSYFFVLRTRALKHPRVRAFWAEILSLGDKMEIIHRYEAGQRAMLDEAGLRIEILFPSQVGARMNRLHLGWRGLLEAGFPFVKAEVLRDNPYGADLSGWRELIEAKGFDVSEVAFHLGAQRDGAAALLEPEKPRPAC